MYAFLTGSHRYGEPTEESDIDLVVYMDPRQVATLRRELCGEDPATVSEDAPIRYGKLNIIVCTTHRKWLAWATGTEELMVRKERSSMGSVTRNLAVTVFDSIRYHLGLGPFNGDSGALTEEEKEEIRAHKKDRRT